MKKILIGVFAILGVSNYSIGQEYAAQDVYCPMPEDLTSAEAVPQSTTEGGTMHVVHIQGKPWVVFAPDLLKSITKLRKIETSGAENVRKVICSYDSSGSTNSVSVALHLPSNMSCTLYRGYKGQLENTQPEYEAVCSNPKECFAQCSLQVLYD